MAPRRHGETSNPLGTRVFTYDEVKAMTGLDQYPDQVPFGQGTFGIVYEGILDDKVVAVKIVKKERGITAVRQWEAEKKYLPMLQYPNIVSMYGHGESDGERFLVLEHLPHKLDNDVIKELDWKDTLRIITEAASALEYINGQSLVFGDFKTDSIMLDMKRKVKLVDLGGMVGLGKMHTSFTTGYGPPEYYGSGKTTDRSDIYCLGIVILQLIMKSETVGQPEIAKPKLSAKVDTRDESTHIYLKAYYSSSTQ